jgi:ferritin-like protein
VAQSAGYHEDPALLTAATIERHRANVSVQEEFEAIDWYDQRVDASNDPALKAILSHNRDEEKEHLAMGLEWLRRQDPVLSKNLKTYLFTTAPVTEVEEEVMSGEGDGAGAAGDGSLGIGSLRGVAQ